MSALVRIPAAQRLRWELEAIASEELAGVLEAWPVLSRSQAAQLAAYLEEEMGDGGMLSVGHAQESGASLGRERQDGRRVLAAIKRQTEV